MANENMAAETARPTTREAIDKLRTMLTEAIAIEADIIGEDEAVKTEEASNKFVLDCIASELRAVNRDANYIVRQLRKIQNRL